MDLIKPTAPEKPKNFWLIHIACLALSLCTLLFLYYLGFPLFISVLVYTFSSAFFLRKFQREYNSYLERLYEYRRERKRIANNEAIKDSNVNESIKLYLEQQEIAKQHAK